MTQKARRIARDIGRDCLARRARLLSRKLTRIYDDALRPAGLTASQLNLLVAIAANPGSRAAELQGRLELEQSSLSRNASLMERRRWIEKRSRPGDRGHTLHLTRPGAALLEEALPHWRAAQRAAKRVLGGDARSLVELVDRHLIE